MLSVKIIQKKNSAKSYCWHIPYCWQGFFEQYLLLDQLHARDKVRQTFEGRLKNAFHLHLKVFLIYPNHVVGPKKVTTHKTFAPLIISGPSRLQHHSNTAVP